MSLGLQELHALAPEGLDCVCTPKGILVLPHSQHRPAEIPKSFVRAQVSCDVRIELGPPPLGVGPGWDAVLRAAMPEATVNEDGQADAGECDIRTTWQHPHIDPKTHATSMQLASQSHLRACPARPEVRHEAADSLTGSPRLLRTR